MYLYREAEPGQGGVCEVVLGEPAQDEDISWREDGRGTRNGKVNTSPIGYPSNIMGIVRQPTSVLLILAIFSRHDVAIQWALDQAIQHWGRVALTSEPFGFGETDYYQSTMGDDLVKQFFAFEKLVDPAQLVEFKHQTNAWELAYGRKRKMPEERPVNLDPGYLTGAKLVLASTKDHAHRIYLAKGIYAEVTLHYTRRIWEPRDWTYPDYRRADYHEFFEHCRVYYRERLAALNP